jgi:hypothetical protein
MNWLLILGIVFVAYTAFVCIYRLFISPIASVPGPRLAALTGWYEAYFELYDKFGGQYLFHIQELHKRYGNNPQWNTRVILGCIRKLTLA